MAESKRYPDTLFDPIHPQVMLSFLVHSVGFIFSFHYGLWNAVFIEAVTVMKRTGVSLFPSHPARGNIGTADDVGQCSAGLLSDLDKGTSSRSVLQFSV